ncbi:hypothetical protein ACJMK2_008354 [Sinanodonta woodiana]|uniref:Large ribosomal subunit protein bL20m n=1 Tax=Sinanodonta woodiana TaxID=1069815 RepID=A0ABD3VLC3_SINWO
MVFLTSFLARRFPLPRAPDKQDNFWRKSMWLRISSKFYGRKRNCFGLAIVPGWRALRYSTRARKLKKENMKNLWEIRLNAACNEHSMEYHTFMTSLAQADIGLNRKVLTDLAIYEPRTFQSLVQFAKQRQLEVGLESSTIDSPHGIFHRGLPNKS